MKWNKVDRWTQLALACLTVVSGSIVPGLPAQAMSSAKKLLISGDNTFFVYAKSGEKMNATFTLSEQKEVTNLAAEDITVSIDGPDFDAKQCVISKAVVTGQGCTFIDVIAPKTGVYRVMFKLPDTAKTFDQVSSVTHWGRNLFDWSLTVGDASGEKSGRIWSELFAIRQPSPPEFAADLVYYYMSESGYLYKATYKGYHGQISTLSADAIGIRKGETCESAYQSIEVSDTKMSPAGSDCGASYKLFFEQPAGELPATAKRWDGKDEWVRPSISRPVVSGLKFESDKNGDTQSGKIKFTLKNFVGQYFVKIDTTDDGNYDATEDIKIPRNLKKLASGEQELTFNGIDGDGKAIPASQRIGVKIQISNVAEIHLVAADVEGRERGLELIRLSGDNAPTYRICWDDTNLQPLAAQALTTEKLDGTNCPDSTGGVHGWKNAVSGSWGDIRYIDDWTYAKAKVDGVAEIHYPETEEATSATVKSYGGLIAAVVGAIVVLGAVGFMITKISARKKLQRDLAQAEQQPQQFEQQQPYAAPQQPYQYPQQPEQPQQPTDPPQPPYPPQPPQQ